MTKKARSRKNRFKLFVFDLRDKDRFAISILQVIGISRVP